MNRGHLVAGWGVNLVVVSALVATAHRFTTPNATFGSSFVLACVSPLLAVIAFVAPQHPATLMAGIGVGMIVGFGVLAGLTLKKPTGRRVIATHVALAVALYLCFSWLATEVLPRLRG